MRLEKLNLYNSIITIIERKKLIENLRSKQFLRSNFVEKKVSVVENHLDFAIAKYNQDKDVGSSVLGRKMLLKHKSYDS